MTEQTINHTEVVALLNRILEAELAGAVHYTHYSLMVYEYNRLPPHRGLAAQAGGNGLDTRAGGGRAGQKNAKRMKLAFIQPLISLNIAGRIRMPELIKH